MDRIEDFLEELDKLALRIAIAKVKACAENGRINLSKLDTMQPRFAIRDGLTPEV